MSVFNPYIETTETVKINVSLSRGINKRADDYENPNNFYQMSTSDVCEELSEVCRTWTSETPVFINAGTGAGKTTFAIKCVAKMAKSRKENVLFVSNRVGIENQIKNILTKEFEEKMILSFAEEVDCFCQIGNVIIANYQSVGPLLTKIKELRIAYAFLDEAHFFVSDSLFADNTDLLLNRLATGLSRVVRIYMSATAWGAIDIISDVESELHNAKVLDSLEQALNYQGYLPKMKYSAFHGQLTEYRFPRKKRNINLVPLASNVLMTCSKVLMTF